MEKMSYNGYEIQATPYQLADSEEWTINIAIHKHYGDKVETRQFNASDKFKTREEAIQHCFTFGKQVIDGKSESCTVVGM